LYTIYIKYVVNSELLRVFNSRRIDEEMAAPFLVNAKQKWKF